MPNATTCYQTYNNNFSILYLSGLPYWSPGS